MARKVSFSVLESRSARLRLKIRRRPYSGPSLARGISPMYRRNKTNGTWVLKVSDGHGAYWTKCFALADKFEDTYGRNVLTFYDAQDAAKKLARGGGTSLTNYIRIARALGYRSRLVLEKADASEASSNVLHDLRIVPHKVRRIQQRKEK